MIIAFVGGDPIRSYGHILDAAFGSVGVISDTLVKATPLILTGLACTLAFRMRLWNIGAEGQLLLGAWGASAVVLFPLLPAGTPGFVLIPAMMLAGALAGAAWGLIPGVLRALLGVNEIIVDADAQLRRPAVDPVLGLRAVERGRLPADRARSPKEAWLPRLTDFADAVPGPRRPHRPSRVPVRPGRRGRRLARRWSGARWGYEIRLVGDSPRAARYAGIDIGG